MGLYPTSPFQGILDNLTEYKDVTKTIPEQVLPKIPIESEKEPYTLPRLSYSDLRFIHFCVDSYGRPTTNPHIINQLALESLHKPPPSSITQSLYEITIRTCRGETLPAHERLPIKYRQLYGTPPPISFDIGSLEPEEITTQIFRFNEVLNTCKGHKNVAEVQEGLRPNIEKLIEYFKDDWNNIFNRQDPLIESLSINWRTPTSIYVYGRGPNNGKYYEAFTPTQSPLLIQIGDKIFPHKFRNCDPKSQDSLLSSMYYLLDMVSIQAMRGASQAAVFSEDEVTLKSGEALPRYPMTYLLPRVVVYKYRKPDGSFSSYEFFQRMEYIPDKEILAEAIARLNVLICSASHFADKFKVIREEVKNRENEIKATSFTQAMVQSSFADVDTSMRQSVVYG